MIAIGYIRVSSQGQLDGDGFDRQKDAITKFCAAHNLEFFAWAEEKGVSGTTGIGDRDALQSALCFLSSKTHEPRCIIVERMDRLARDLMVSEMLLRELRSRGIKVYSTDQGLVDVAADTGIDPTRKLIRQIMGAVSEWDKSQLVLKMAKARKRKRDKDGRCEGAKPYGFHPHEAKIKEVIAHYRTRGINDYAYIADMLNAQGYKSRKGKPWTAWKVQWVTTGSAARYRRTQQKWVNPIDNNDK